MIHSTKHSAPKAHSLVELLATIAVISILAALTVPATIKSYKHCKMWIWGIYAFNENRIESVDNDAMLERYCASKPAPWTPVSSADAGANAPNAP